MLLFFFNKKWPSLFDGTRFVTNQSSSVYLLPTTASSSLVVGRDRLISIGTWEYLRVYPTELERPQDEIDFTTPLIIFYNHFSTNQSLSARPAPAPAPPLSTHIMSLVFHPNPTSQPSPHYYICVFTSIHQQHVVTSGRNEMKNDDDEDSYAVTAKKVHDLAQLQEGYLGDDSVRNSDGFGITVSYWRSEEDIKHWKQQIDHAAAQKAGQQRFYDDYHIHIAKVEREYAMPTTTRR